MNMQNKKAVAITSSIILVLLIIICVFSFETYFSDKLQVVSERGLITDRNGKALAECDSVILLGVERHYVSTSQGENGQPGKSLRLSIDAELQNFGEKQLNGMAGCIVAIEPATGEVLCIVSSTPFNQCVMGQYTPGGVFKVVQSLIFLSEGIITPETCYPCEKVFKHNGIKVDCHAHASPLILTDALRLSCNGFFCRGYLDMMRDAKYGSSQMAFEKWREYVLSLGFGSRMGIDLPGERRGLIPSAEYYNTQLNEHWNGLTNLSNAIGLGEIIVTPLQLANLSATIANRGYYFTPHVVKEKHDEAIYEEYKSVHYSMMTCDSYDIIIDALRSSASWGISGMITRKEKNHYSYIGFAPIENPQIAVAVYIENCGVGGNSAARIGESVIEEYLRNN